MYAKDADSRLGLTSTLTPPLTNRELVIGLHPTPDVQPFLFPAGALKHLSLECRLGGESHVTLMQVTGAFDVVGNGALG